MMDGNDLATETTRRGVISQAWNRASQIYQSTLDRWTPHTRARWAGAVVLLLIFLLRVFTKQGWYIVTYALGIYHLNLFIAFLTPKIDPAMDFDVIFGRCCWRPITKNINNLFPTQLSKVAEEFLIPKLWLPLLVTYGREDDNGPALPTRATEEFRPFIRRLPEFKFWLSVTKSTLIGFACTFIDAFNIPVFWPILVMYFLTLFCITMKRQIKHMIKYRYLPFTHNKPRYKTVEPTVSVN